MAKANVILLNSILWNLRELTKLIEKIKEYCGDVDCTSWRYPLTSCSELEIFKLLQNNRNLDNYTFILELTYDRLLYLFNLIIKYLESTDSLKSFRPNKNVCRPKTLSLAAVLHMIWDRIRERTEGEKTSGVTEKFYENEPENILKVTEFSTSKSSIYTQSEISSIVLCSCCEMVQQFVTQLILEMEKAVDKLDFSSAISNERKIMRENLAEMTTWSAMSKWLSAILQDFNGLIDKVEKVTTHSRRLKTRLESGEKKIKFKTDQHEEEIRKLEIRLKDQETKIIDLKQKLDKLIEDKNILGEQIKQKNSQLESQNSEFQQKIDELKKNYENKLKEKKQKNLKKEKEKELELKQELEAKCVKSKELAEQNGRFEKIILQLSESLEQANLKAAEEKDIWLNKHKSFENKIEQLQKENLSLQTILKERERTISDYSIRLMEAFPDLNDVSDKKLTASGIPEIDMEYQIEANNYRIDLLKSENEKLQRTITKIKSLKG